jgi:REP element-mobilizing transposase RayT
VWTTKERTPLLTAEIEPIVYSLLRSKATQLEAQVFALDGIEDHVHMVVSIPAKLAVARFVGQVKAVSSALLNKAHPNRPPFFWQEEYGAFTLDLKRLPNHVTYVQHQKEHHQHGTTIPALEKAG